MDGVVPVYFEAAAVITVLVLLGQVLELRAREQTGGAIRALLNLAPKTARRIRADGSDEEVALDASPYRRPAARAPGRQRAGRRRRRRGPQRRRRIDGHRRIDAGRERPSAKVIGGTINGTGSLVMRAEKIGADTMLARIVQMVADAQRSRAPIQRLADTVSAWFVPAVIAGGGRGLRRLDDVGARRPLSPTRWSPRCRWSSSPARARSGWRRRCRSWSASARAPRRAC